MVNLPEDVMAELNNPKSSRVLGTTSSEGVVHLIQVGSLVAPSPNMIAFGAILMKVTNKNLEGMMKKKGIVSILVTNGMKSYEVKAKVKDYQTSGPVFEKLSEELKKMGLTVRGAWILEPVEVWNQSATYDAGKKIA